ncbi:ankyrin [Zopfia rhizophila CBS 207.26]|uniref:Ankyrin n=1 Tax=Zopfia rhizophila CBS 207.26 TaxID=1314779 RepID=A0A6A6ET06_9PEZI|nr:ankyrin [Zopfia rhizophila CBS 207.26]
MSPAGPDFQSHGPVQGNNVLQGVTTGDNTIINFLESGKGGALQDEREACLRTLGFLEIDSREQDISAAVEQTCDWLFDTLEFKTWRNRTDLATNNGVLCIKGKPGAGKSTLMKHTLEHCKNAFPDDLIIAYFFNARGSTLEKSPLGMLRSIAYQLVKKDVTLFDQFLVTFRDKHITSQGREWEWQPRELKAFITSIIKRWKSKPLLLLVDALDECNEADMQDVVDFLESLSIDANKLGTTLRICLSRRHHPPLRIAKSLELIVEDNEDHREDIATYIRAKLAKRDAEIEAEIEKKADGIFMWVVLVVRLLNKALFKVRGKNKAMQDALEEIPGELEEVFRIMFNEDDEDMAETVLMLQWVLFAQRPLTPEELYAAVEAGDTGLWSQSSDIDHDSIQQSIEHLSKGLIEIRGRDAATVQFIHLSVNDFLLRNKRLQTLDQALEPDPVTASHRRLWACCWSHIRQVSSTSTKEAYKELRRKYPFLGYAASYILDHAEKVLDEGAVGQAGVTIEKWLRDGSSWFEWWKSFLSATHAFGEHTYLEGNMDAGLLYMLSLRGYGSLVKCMLAEDGEEGAEVNAQGGEYGNALQAASAGGKQQIVESLLKAGAEVNAQGGDYGNALQAASRQGEQQIVESLLKAGAEVNAQGDQYGNTFGKALQAALHQKHHGIANMLRKAGATAIVQHTESEVVNAGVADTEGVSVEKRHEGASPEAAPAMASPSTEAPSPGIWFPLRLQGIYASPRLALLWPGLFFIGTGGVILWLVRGGRVASTLFGDIWRNRI